MGDDLAVIRRSGKIGVGQAKQPFEDSYTFIHIRPFSLKSRGLPENPVECITFSRGTPEYDSLTKLMVKVNLFKPRINVPIKPVEYKVPGKSMLTRDKLTGEIKLHYRVKGGKFTEGGIANNDDICFLTDEDKKYDPYSSWAFYEEAYRHPKFNYSYMDPSHPLYYYWSEYMDESYIEKAGYKYAIKSTRPDKPSQNQGLRELVENSYSWAIPGSDTAIIEALAERGLCKLDKEKTCLYDKNGYFLCELAEAKEKEGSGEIFNMIIDWLDDSDLSTSKRIIDQFEGGFL